eukprot:gene2038-3961_t
MTVSMCLVSTLMLMASSCTLAFLGSPKNMNQGHVRLSMTYCLNVNIFVKPERREDFLAAIRANAKGTLTTEKANRLYTWGESCTDPNTFHFQEQFEDEDGFKAHTQAPHFMKWEEFTKSDPFTKPPELSFFKTLA